MSGRKPVLPWHSTPSVRVGLPTVRSLWLAIVLPAIDATTTHPRTAKLLATEGYDLGPRPEAYLRAWFRWLTTAQAAGELPEHPDPFPRRTPGGQKGDQPSPESAVGKKIASRRKAPSGTSD